MWKVFDTDGSGGISHDEFAAVMTHQTDVDTSRQLAHAIEVFRLGCAQ